MKKLRLDTDKVKMRGRIAGYMSLTKIAEAMEELGDKHRVGRTAFFTSLGEYEFKSKVVNSLALVVRCDPLDILTVDEVNE